MARGWWGKSLPTAREATAVAQRGLRQQQGVAQGGVWLAGGGPCPWQEAAQPGPCPGRGAQTRPHRQQGFAGGGAVGSPPGAVARGGGDVGA